MPFRGPEADPAVSPDSFEAKVDWLERWSYGLVLLEEYPLGDLEVAVTEVERAVRAHRASSEGWVTRLLVADELTAQGAQVVLSDHERFETSIEQLRWFLGAVVEEDHGGHRQALGQYGKVLAEALRRHLADERRLEARSSAVPGAPVP